MSGQDLRLDLPTGGTAVMARRADGRDAADDFPTPSWPTRALWRRALPELGDLLRGSILWEPCAGRLTMARPLAESGAIVFTSDLLDYGAPLDRVGRFQDLVPAQVAGGAVDWIVTNPPFVQADEMWLHAWEHARVGVAFLLRLSWLEGGGRWERIFYPGRMTFVCPFSERVPMVKGRLDRKASTATAYAWFVGLKADPRPYPQVRHVPPCRATLERPEDWTGWAPFASEPAGDDPGGLLGPGSGAGAPPGGGG